MIEGFDKHYRLFRAVSAQARERFEAGGLGGAAAGGAGADPLLRRARARVRRPAPRRVRRRRAHRRDLARREAPLHRPPRRAQPAGARRDVLQLGDRAHPAAHLLRQRPDLRARGDLHRAHRVPTRRSTAATTRSSTASTSASRASSATSAGAARSPTSTATSTASWAPSGDGPAARGPTCEPNHQIQVLRSAFYRNKAAYVFGKVVNGHDELPFVVPVLRRRRRRPRAGRDPARPAADQHASSRSRARTSWSTWRCRPAYVEFLRSMAPKRAALRALHAGRPRQAGQDALRPRAAAAPAPLPATRSSRRRGSAAR